MGNVDSSGDILDSRASLLSHVACRGLGEAEGQPTIDAGKYCRFVSK